MKHESEAVRGRPSQDLDQRLLTVAREILEREGLEALTLRAAARAAGVSHMAPYRHYASKDELLAAVAESGFAAMIGAMDDTAGKRPDKAGRIECLGMAYVLFAIENPSLYRLMFGCNLPKRTRFPKLIEAGNLALERCARVLESEGHKRSAGEPQATPKDIALWSLLHGLASLTIDSLVDSPNPQSPNLRKEVQAVLASWSPTAH